MRNENQWKENNIRSTRLGWALFGSVCIVILCKQHVLLPLWYLIAHAHLSLSRIYACLSECASVSVLTWAQLSSPKFILDTINFKIMAPCYTLHHRILEINSNSKWMRVRVTYEFSFLFQFLSFAYSISDVFLREYLPERLISLFGIGIFFVVVVILGWFAFIWDNRT